jgi:hypothetical protein
MAKALRLLGITPKQSMLPYSKSTRKLGNTSNKEGGRRRRGTKRSGTKRRRTHRRRRD